MIREVCVYVDGGLASSGNPGPGACAAVVVCPDGVVCAEHAIALEHVTSNEAEYRGFLLGAGLARMIGAEVAHFVSDSQLVVRQLGSLWAINDPKLARLHGVVTSALMEFERWSIQHVMREQNKRADYLCNRLLRPGGSIARRDLPEMPFRSSEHPTPGWPRSAA